MNSNYDLERALLGAILEKPEIAESVFTRVPPQEFTGPNMSLAETLQAMSEGGGPITPTSLLTRLREAGLLNRVGGAPEIHSLSALGWRNAEDLDGMVGALEREVTRRQLRMVGTRMVQQSENYEIDPEWALDTAKQGLESITRGTVPLETLGWPSPMDDSKPPQWVIPGLLAADERVMLTGPEGFGKTMLIRQLVASVAVGRHPFTFREFTPAPALHLDLENPRYLTDASYRRIRNGLYSAGVEPGDLLHRLEPRVFSVENARDVTWLMRAVRTLQPALIAVGPLKNMSTADLNEERNAVRVQDVLNRIRAETGAALILEGHAGHAERDGKDKTGRPVRGSWRPRGSASFLGWPEFGYGLRPTTEEYETVRTAELVQWRKPRAEGRNWPQYLVQGTPWPWSEDTRREA